MKRIEWILARYYSQLKDYGLGKEAEFFLTEIYQFFNMGEHEKEEISKKAKLVWLNRQYIFGTNTTYENILLGMALEVLENNRPRFTLTNSYEGPESMSDFIRQMDKEKYNKNLISICINYDITKDIFINNYENKEIIDYIIESLNFSDQQQKWISEMLDMAYLKRNTMFKNISEEDIIVGILGYLDNECQILYKNGIAMSDLIKALTNNRYEKKFWEIQEVCGKFQRSFPLRQ
ncbi:hypothetical protein [Methanohalophilus profundi]|uniref:hypothetical protein n=1 Tax=Methanohalophilus profundi TaxID=2138083 RepID=UPI00101C3DB3|nr:hypothetical protein [Methanohalophilus profundi]